MALLIGSSTWLVWVTEGQQPPAGDHHLDCLRQKLEQFKFSSSQDTSKQDAVDSICQAASTTFPRNAPKPADAPHFVMARSYHPTPAVGCLISRWLATRCALRAGHRSALLGSRKKKSKGAEEGWRYPQLNKQKKQQRVR